MAEYKSFDNNVEILGAAILPVIDGMGAFREKGLQILKKHGIEDIQADQWYSQQAYLDALKEIGMESVLKQIGIKIPENAKFPPGIDNVISALGSIGEAYKMNHRNGDIGYYKFTKIDEKSGKIECKNPFPCSFDEGIILGMGRKFADEHSFIKVTHDKGECRKSGGDSCTYTVKW